jgi:hypothetical protein
MSFPLFKFTLSNAIEGSLQIKEPEGWDDGILTLDRNKEYHSLVEMYDQPMTYDDAEATDLFSGDILPGGMAYIKNVEYTQGVGAVITQTIEISEDEGETWETIFIGVIDLETVKEIDFYKVQYGVNRDDFWAKLINRKSTPVNLGDSVDLDGNSRTVINPITVNMQSQILRERYVRNTNYNNGNEGLFQAYTAAVDTQTYLIFDTSRFDVDEIEERFEYGTQISDENPTASEKYLIKAKFGGTYNVQATMRYTIIFNASVNADISWYYAVRKSGVLTTTQFGTTSSGAGITQIFDNGTETLNQTFDLQPGDELYIYGRMNLNVSPTATYFADYDSDSGGGFVPVYTSLVITADTFYKETTAQVYKIKDAFESVVSKITGNDNTISSGYLTSGCGANFAITRGKNIRGLSFVEKLFSQSLDDLWGGINPTHNLGLSYLYNQNKIEILPKAELYNRTVLLNLDFVNNIERSYDRDYIFKSIEIGYEKPTEINPEDPFGRHRYATRIPVGGKEERQLSKFIAASITLEETRREEIKEGSDWKYDDDTFILSIYQDGGSWIPRFSRDFNGVTGLLNEDDRMNLELTVARNMNRWLNYVSGCLQIPSGQEIIFIDGTGNYDATTQLNPDACEATDETPEPVLSESQDFDASDDFLFLPILYTFDHPLTFEEYKIIRDNRKNAIGVSRTDANHVPCFIKSLQYRPTRKLATFEVWLGENSPLGMPDYERQNVLISTGLGDASFTGYAPTVTVQLDNIDSGVGEVTFTGIAPTVTVDNPS